MKTILITGGAGFIGSHLCEALLIEGNQIICVDNISTGSTFNITDLVNKWPSSFTFIHHDICHPLNLTGIDEIYNLACPASPIQYQKNPIKTIETNTLGVSNILKLAKSNQARILQASTSEVYGDPLEHPQKEEYFGNVNPIGPRSCYDEGKRCAEALIYAYQTTHKVDARVVRIFNTYGPRMDTNDGRVVSNFVIQALNGDHITIYGDGSQTRSFCHVDDTVKGLIKVMESDITTPVNIGNPKEMTIAQLAKLVIKMTGSTSIIVKNDLPKDDPVKRKPDIGKAKALLGWTPKVPLETGLKTVIEYFKSILY